MPIPSSVISTSRLSGAWLYDTILPREPHGAERHRAGGDVAVDLGVGGLPAGRLDVFVENGFGLGKLVGGEQGCAAENQSDRYVFVSS